MDGDTIDAVLLSLEEGEGQGSIGSILETVEEESQQYRSSALSKLKIPELPEHDEEKGHQQQQGEGNPEGGHRGPQQLFAGNEDDYTETLAGISANSIDGTPSDEGTPTSGVDDSNKKKIKKSNHVRFQPPRSASKRGLFRSPNHTTANNQGQQVQIRGPDMRAAMDENSRRRHQFKKRIYNLMGGGEDSSDDEGSMKISMHGRLMVQPSKRVLDIEENASFDAGDDEEKKRAETQYRLATVKKKTRNLVIPGMYEDTSSLENTGCCWICPSSDRVTSPFLHFLFRSPFVVVFGTAAISWFSLTLTFAFFYWMIGSLKGHCIGTAVAASYENSTAPFMDAYQLSWTTFSTVGYGVIYPANSATHTPIHECTLITVLTCFEAFIGVLFSSLCAALMFAKVARVQSFAQVSFSDPMVIRYGTGLMKLDDDDDDDASSGDRNDPHIPCPVLEFRIFNRMSSIQGGEIIDATLSMVASLDASQADATLQARNGRRKRGKRGKKKSGTTQHKQIPIRNRRSPDRIAMSDGSEVSSPVTPDRSARQSVVLRDSPLPLPERGPAPSLVRRFQSQRNVNKEPIQSAHRAPPIPVPSHFGRELRPGGSESLRRGWSNSVTKRFPSMRLGGKRARQDSRSLLFNQRMHQVSMRNTDTFAFEEDPTGKCLAKLEVESPDHPFFRRIWLVRHTLDMNSLLVKPNVRQMIRRNHGYWPKELNNYESIRASIDFDQVLVSLSGTSNADANSVYAQHVYHMVDVNVGYRFVDALYRKPKDGSLAVDGTLINDVMEQTGGGGEPLQAFDPDNFREMLVL